jgi:hypothetical protein
MIWTIELNLDYDYANACAYHVDDEKSTFKTNMRHALDGKTTDRWVIIGYADSLQNARDRCTELRKELCKLGNKTPYGIRES